MAEKSRTLRRDKSERYALLGPTPGFRKASTLGACRTLEPVSARRALETQPRSLSDSKRSWTVTGLRCTRRSQTNRFTKESRFLAVGRGLWKQFLG